MVQVPIINIIGIQLWSNEFNTNIGRYIRSDYKIIFAKLFWMTFELMHACNNASGVSRLLFPRHVFQYCT